MLMKTLAFKSFNTQHHNINKADEIKNNNHKSTILIIVNYM